MKTQDIIILHGWGLSGRTFLPLIRVLKKRGYRVHAPDLPGFGTTPKLSEPYTLSRYVETLHDFVRKEAMDRPLIIGHSFGGRIALSYAALYPGRIRALIITGTPGYHTAHPLKELKRYLAIVGAKTGKLLFRFSIVAPFLPPVRTWYYRRLGVRDYTHAEGYLKETFTLVVSQDLAGYMRRIQCPTLLIWGEHDILVPVSIARKMVRTIPGSRLTVISGGDHSVAYTKPDIFAKAVETFLSSV